MRRAHYLVIGGLAALAVSAYLLGGGISRGGQETTRWCAPVRAADGDGPAATQPRPPADAAGDRLFARLLGERYGVPESIVARALHGGDSFGDVALAANLAARVGRPFEEVRRFRQNGDSWDEIARRFGVSVGMLSEPVLPALSAGDEALLRETLARDYRMSELTVARLRREGFAASDILVAAVLTGGGEAAVIETLHARRRGEEWQVAAQGSLVRHAADAAPARGRDERPSDAGAGESIPYCRALLTGYYGLRAQEVDAAARRGLPWMDLLVAANAAARSGQPFEQVIALRSGGASWRVVEQRLGLNAGEAMKLPAPSAQQAAGKPTARATDRPSR